MEMAQSVESVVLPYDGNVVTLCGVVKRVSVHERYAAFVVDVKNCGRVGADQSQTDENVLVRLDISQKENSEAFLYDAVGRHIRINGKITCPDGRRNPGGFDYALYLKGKNIHALCDVSLYQFKKGTVSNTFLHSLSVAKGAFYVTAKEKLQPQAFALLAGILFGEKNYMREEVLEQFQLNGISHVLAVSGLHVALLYTALIKIFSGRKDVKISICIELIIFSYVALCSFSISVMRAFGMILMAIGARHLRRRYDLTTAASAMAILFVSINPFQIFDAGLQLSFLAAYSLGVILPYLNIKLLEMSHRLKKGWITELGKFLGPCLVVQLSMSPLIAFHFLMFCPIGILMNPPSVALVGVLLPVGLLMFVASLLLHAPLFGLQESTAIFEVVFSGLANIANFLCETLIKLSDLGGKVGAFGDSIAPPLGMLFLFYFICFLFFSETRFIALRRNKRQIFSIFLACAIFFICTVPAFLGMTASVLPWRYETSYITFLDVGQGDSVHIKVENRNILVDGGGHFYTDIGKRVLMPYLLKNGIDHIDLAIVTHSDMDHRKGIEELSVRMPIHKLLVGSAYENAPLTYSDIICDEVLYAAAGNVITLDENVYISVLAPSLSYELSDDNNENSLVMMLHYNGIRILLTGDIGMVSENGFIKSASCDILKVAHHGSAYSTSETFLYSADPSCAVISCGKNNLHGHPSPRVIELLQNSGIITCRTDDFGAISLYGIFDTFFLLRNASKEKAWKVFRRDTNDERRTCL